MSLEKIINDAWEIKDKISPSSDPKLKDAINQIIAVGLKRIMKKLALEWFLILQLEKDLSSGKMLY